MTRPNPNDMTVGEAALYYANDTVLAASVFPINPRSKTPYKNPPGTPAGQGGLYLATRDAAQIRQWFETEHPEAMVAMRTDGYLVFDFDLDPTCGHNRGLEEDAEPDDFPETLRARTPRAGDHYFYRLPDGVVLGPTVSVIAPYVDTRSSHSYVALPPSRRDDGKEYRWMNWGAPVVQAPERWVEFLIKRGKAGHGGGASGQALDFSTLTFPEHPTPYAAKTLQNVCAEVAGAPERHRHGMLLSASTRLGQLIAGEQTDPERARDALTAAGLACGLPESEITRVISDGFRYGSARPQRIIDPGLKALAEKCGRPHDRCRVFAGTTSRTALLLRNPLARPCCARTRVVRPPSGPPARRGVCCKVPPAAAW